MIYLKTLIFSLFLLNILFPFYYLVTANQDQFVFNSEICSIDNRQITNNHQLIWNLSYQKWVLSMSIKIENNLPSFIKRTSDNSKEFKSLLSNFLYSNLFYT